MSIELPNGHYVNGAVLDPEGEYSEVEPTEALRMLQTDEADQCADPQCGMVHTFPTDELGRS